MNTYTLDEITGELHVFRSEPKIEKVLGLFAYETEENIGQIEREYPILFPSYESLFNWIGKDIDKNFENLVKKNQTVVIRWIKIVK